MASKRGCTSFAAEVQVEEIPLENYDDDSDNETDGDRNAGLQRSLTDAHLSEYRPQHRVRFNSLSAGVERQLSTEEYVLLGAKSHELGHVYWSGGWQDTVFRRRRKGLSPRSEEEEVQEIANAMEEDQRLMADDIDGEVLRRDALRELTKSLKMRKEIKQRLTTSRHTIRRSTVRHLSYYQIFKYSLSMKWFHFKEQIETALHDYSLWHKDLKAIEGIYGSSVGSYFRFLRFLFVINSLVAVAIIGFVFVPQMMFDSKSKENYDEYLMLQTGETFSASDDTTTINGSSTERFGALDWLTGAGWFSGTKLYYGGYTTGSISSFNSTMSYDMSQAYFYTVSTSFTFYLVVLLYKIFTMYRLNYIDTEEDISGTFVEKIFSAWDFNITDEKSANIKHRSIYNELMELLQEYNEEEVVESLLQRLGRRLLQCAVWFVLVTFLLLLGGGLYLLLKEELYDLAEMEVGYWKRSMLMLVYPLIVSLLMVVIPLVFEAIGRMEKYARPRRELYANVVRVFFLEVVILVALIVFWFENSPGLKYELKPLQHTLMQRPTDFEKHVAANSNKTAVECWESALGEEIYRLVFIDFFVILISNLVVDSIKPILVRRGKARDSILQFSISRSTLHIVYNQTLLWAGLFFCPLLPLIISLKFLLIFYLQKFSVIKKLEPNDRPWRAAQTETLFYALTLLSLILAVFSFGFILVRGYSSPTCGPFQGHLHYIDIVWNVKGESEKILLRFLAFILRPGFIMFFLGILSLSVYCLKNICEGRSQLAALLRRQLQLEMKDRVFLQKLIEKVMKGEYPPPHSAAANSNPIPSDPEPKHLTKRSSFVYSRNSSGVDEPDASTFL